MSAVISDSQAFIDLLGPKLVTKDNADADTAVVLEGKTVGIYFSAHWCPPCRGFTPQLAAAYSSNLKAKGLEIVFVSSDQGQEEFNNYYGEMPWTALPFANRAQAQKVSAQFKVKGIPAFVILDSSGNVLNSNARQCVAQDPEGEKFPWEGMGPPDLKKVFTEAEGGNPERAAVAEREYQEVMSKVVGSATKGMLVGCCLSPCTVCISCCVCPRLFTISVKKEMQAWSNKYPLEAIALIKAKPDVDKLFPQLQPSQEAINKRRSDLGQAPQQEQM
mmetsp:Transcript_124851/g.230198  ORF Transcript_124851/g.230198 Transcript_124851/m.230198 type:complete len:275 (+) Transcript_124851:79-903(+)